ncbi:MAG: DUF2089 domain-containing protein [Firmicutes bacterium]|jgi:hypothetical protein|nr:DUF2089 domain-containing protein [Bacillota bacterium]
MKRRALGRCPVCGESLEVTKLSCSRCDTSISGHFETCKFCQMTDEQRNFVATFIRCRGNIKEVERELGISYPTVRGRLDTVIQALGFPIESDKEDEAEAAARRKEILDSLATGELGAEEAVKLLKQK